MPRSRVKTGGELAWRIAANQTCAGRVPPWRIGAMRATAGMPRNGKPEKRSGRLRTPLSSLHSADVVEGRRHAVDAGQVELETGPGSGVIRNELPLERVPRVAFTPAAIRNLPLDHRTGFVLWLVDGKSSIGDIFDASPIPVQEVSDILCALVALGVVTLE